jgi:NADH dehydrogenase/NADH:ubiquinone oxidoreductase subunit G
MSIQVTINGQIYPAEKGEYILEVARRNRIPIPSLCHLDALPGLGCCRLCVVEVNESTGGTQASGRAEGSAPATGSAPKASAPKVVVSCVYPLSRNCEVFTESDKIKRIRRGILSMLRDRAPEGKRLASLCGLYQVPAETRYTPAQNEKCVLCGLCTLACATLGAGAIATVSRGIGKKISSPYDEPSRDCIGCASCALVCPTGAIDCTETGGRRIIWNKSFELLRCENCGALFATREEWAYSRAVAADEPGQAAPAGTLREAAAADQSSPGEAGILCELCRRKKIAGVMAAAFGERIEQGEAS